MATVTLRCGTTVLVDDEYVALVKAFAWMIDRKGYVVRKPSKGTKTLILHRIIAGAKDGQLVDHADQNKLNNCKSNLRFATLNENAQNCKKRSGTTSRHKGVTWQKSTNKWQASIKADGKFMYLGCFSDEDEAGHAYNKAAVQFFGEFAALNPIGAPRMVMEAS